MSALLITIMLQFPDASQKQTYVTTAFLYTTIHINVLITYNSSYIF